MHDDDPAKPLSDLLEPGSTLMVGTSGGSPPFEFRPLTVARVEGSRIEILLDTQEDWVASLADGDMVYVTMSDTRSNTWVSLTGSASTTDEAALIDELWSPFAGAYFEHGRETPGIAVLQIDSTSGRYWTAPSGRIGSLVSIVKAKFGDPEQAGEHGHVKV